MYFDKKKLKTVVIIILLMAGMFYLYNRAIQEKKGENDYDKKMEEEIMKADS
jgi:cbb3-type cytochrome oxidase subunit 3